MLRIAICDDDAKELARMRTLVNDFLIARDVSACMREFSAAKELLFDLGGGSLYDLYLLDVIMPEMNGIELGIKLRESDDSGTIIYLTTSEDHAVDSYEARAFWYLIKPIKPDRLFPILDKAIAARHKLLTDAVHIKTKNGTARILLREIIYAQPAGRAVRYVCANETIESITDTASFREKIGALLNDKRFYLCGASIVLNLQHVKAIDRSAVRFGTGGQLEIPRRAAVELRFAWQRYWLEGGRRP